MKLKTIVTDTYDFPTLIRDGNVYVDKTAYLHRLVSKVDGTMFFMSRPRRFGKSLMISTLEQIFLGNRKLFRELAISKLDCDWKMRNEAEAKRYFLLFMKMAGADITPELESSKGRADAIVETEKAVYVFEFKYGKTAKTALRQIDERDYVLPYAGDRRKVICIGLNYNAKTASLDAPLIVEAINGKVNGKVNGWIAAHPGCKRLALIRAVGKSARTVDRALAELIADKAVEFLGAPKTGGYYVR